jgi:hypothetical protein
MHTLPLSQTVPKAINSTKFKRRKDLSTKKRLIIAIAALHAQIFGEWGRITELSREFGISRRFVYMLLNTMLPLAELCFGEAQKEPSIAKQKRLSFEAMLALRLTGQSAIERISSIMKRFGMRNASVGFINHSLKQIGAILPNTASTEGNEIAVVIFLSDEIFCKQIPILVTVEPISSAILRIELADGRKAENWKHHWKCLEENGYYTAYLVCDEGKGLCTAKGEALPDAVRQPDTYHAIAHRLGIWVERLEKAAYKAIEEEDYCHKKLDSARSGRVINKRTEGYEEAKREADKKIELYESFHYLYHCLIAELRIFGKNGRVRRRMEAEDNIRACLDLIESLENEKLNKQVKKVRRILPDLLNYFDTAIEVVRRLENRADITQDALDALCLAWQWHKSVIKSKKPDRTKNCKENERFWLEYVHSHLQEDYKDIKEQIYRELDTIVQSSALVECINSIIRPYLNSSKNHVSQEMLNLIMFYHNHRRYNAGKRKGKTPLEILTGKQQQEDWITLLIDQVRKKDPSILPFS